MKRPEGRTIRPLPRYMDSRPYAKYYYNPQLPPDEYWDSLGDNEMTDPAKLLRIQDRNEIFAPGYAECRRGWTIFEDGTGACHGWMDFPNCTPEMLYWWFSWMLVDPLRGRLWEPYNHLDSLILREVAEKAADRSVPLERRTWGLYFYPVDIGARPFPDAEKAPGRIEFVSPAEFGLDVERMKAANTATICAKAGPSDKPLACFIHTMRPTATGAEMISRFWFGWHFENGQPVKNDTLLPAGPLSIHGKSLSIHLLDEYYPLSRILEKLYNTYKDVPDDVLDYV